MNAKIKKYIIPNLPYVFIGVLLGNLGEAYRLSAGADIAHKITGMAYVSVPSDLSKVKTKMVLNLTKRQLLYFGAAAIIGVPTYLFTCSVIGNTGAMVLMIVLMLPCFFFAMYERDGLPFEKVLRNIVRSTFLWPRMRPYQTDNFYSYLSNPRKEVQQFGTSKKAPARSGPKRSA